MRFGGARGPPGNDGVATICTGRGVGGGNVGFRRISSLLAMGPAVDAELFSRLMLLFLPIDAKNPTPIEDLEVLCVEGTRWRDVEAIEPAAGPPNVREGGTRTPCARLG